VVFLLDTVAMRYMSIHLLSIKSTPEQPVSSSRVLRLVSGMSVDVNMPSNLMINDAPKPVYMNNAKISITWPRKALVPP